MNIGPRRPLAVALVVGLVVVLVGVGTSVSIAAWTAATSKSATVTAATPAVGSTGLDTLAATYKPGLTGVTGAALADTAAVTVTNSGSTPLAYGLSSTGGNSALNSSITLQVWKTGTTCNAATAVPSGATSGTLAAPPALPSDANSAAIGAAVSLCLRTSITAANQATYTGQATAPTVSVVGTVGSNWTATSAVAFTQSVTFSWFELVHDLSAKCVASNGTTVVAGTTIVLGTCKALSSTNNQAFRFAQVGATSNYRVYIGAGAATGPVLASASPNSGAAVTLAAVDTANTTNSNNQQWSVVQHGDALDFRIVLKGSNAATQNTLCLTAAASADGTAFTATTCGTSTNNTNTTYRNQHFTFTEVP